MVGVKVHHSKYGRAAIWRNLGVADDFRVVRLVKPQGGVLLQRGVLPVGAVEVAHPLQEAAVLGVLQHPPFQRLVVLPLAPLPELAGVPERHYDLIATFDVIEHIDDDHAAVAAIASRLKPGGTYIATVPAHQWIWSAHDVVSHHKRRYSKRSFRALIDGSPLHLEKIGYLNSLLFPLALAQRLTARMRRNDDAGLELPAGPINTVLERIFAAERLLIGRVPLPPGLSLFAIASAPKRG